MATGRFVRVNFVGDRTGTYFGGEIWNTGFSLVDTDFSDVVVGGVREPLPEFAATAIGEREISSPFDIDWAWEGTSTFTKANQIALAGVANTFWAAIKAYTPTDLRLTEIRISAFAVGTTKPWEVINGANVFSLSTPVAGTASAANQLPAQCAVTVSLRTGARGPAGRGRMFLPLTGVSETNGMIGSSTKTNLGAACVDLCEDTRALGPLMAIINRGPSTYSAVNDIQIGDYFDVIRRRENNIAEAYTSYTPTLS